jgi:hypothetical protein
LIYWHCPTNIKKENDEIPETQQPALASPSASRGEAGHRKRKAEIESNDREAAETRRKAVKDMNFISGRAGINQRDKSIHKTQNMATRLPKPRCKLWEKEP